MKSSIILIACAVVAIPGYTQNSVDRVLEEISRNNKSIMVNSQLVEAQRLTFKTGLTPLNPRVEYDYLPGTPEGAGIQRDFQVTQGFDFPTSYLKRIRVSDHQIAKSRLEAKAFRQNVLLEAKSYCIELIYRNKLHQEFNRRFAQSSKIYQGYKARLDNGQGNVLDVHKASLHLLSIKTETRVNESARTLLLHRLAELNGGTEISLPDTIYSSAVAVPAFEEMDSLIEANDPVLKAYRQEKQVAEHQSGLSRSMALPKLEVGYHSQAILGQEYRGAHFGVSIPLWENKNRVKAQDARVIWSDLQVRRHSNDLYYSNKQLYEQYLTFKNTFEEYQKLLAQVNNTELLTKALNQGEISSLEYFVGLGFFYDAYDNYLLAEKELQVVVARLYKFLL